jgi:glyoxylase-like metal-dependent hydrolase (beta-lactamase superfamily II)
VSAMDSAREPFVPNLKVSHINDYLICFYDGREIASYPEWIKGNIDMKLGVCNYVLHRGDKAIVFDTMVYGEQMEAIDAYIRQMGIRHVSVINSHWDCDHIAGNYLYKNSDIIATNRTRWKLQAYAPQMLSGEIWGAGDPHYPGVKEVVLPNRTFDGRMTVWLEDLQIDLIETFVHQLGHLVAYLPKDRILLAADAVEDTVTFNTQAMTSEISAQIMTYRQLLAIDAKALYPCHGRFEVIDNGGYTQEFTEAILDYNIQLLKRKDETDYLSAPLESFIQPWLDRGVLAMHEPYRWLHNNNVTLIDKAYGGRSTPNIPE